MQFNRPGFLSSLPTIVFNLIVINTLMWLASAIVAPRIGFDITDILGMHFWRAQEFNPLQFVSYMFMHDTSSFMHLFFNMFGIYMFASDIERIWGWKKFLFFYLLCGIGAGICQQLAWEADLSSILNAWETSVATGSTELLYNMGILTANVDNVPPVELLAIKNKFLSNFITVGASGSLFGILLAFGWLFPERRIMLLFIPVPIPARIFVGIYAVVELFLGVGNFASDSVAHFAHLGGMIFAAIILFIWKTKGKLYS